MTPRGQGINAPEHGHKQGANGQKKKNRAKNACREETSWPSPEWESLQFEKRVVRYGR